MTFVGSNLFSKFELPTVSVLVPTLIVTLPSKSVSLNAFVSINVKVRMMGIVAKCLPGNLLTQVRFQLFPQKKRLTYT